MAEFKVNSAQLEAELGQLEAAANNLTTNGADISSEGVSTLKTSMRYIEQQKEIGKIIGLYAELLRKDIRDIRAMQASAEKMDETLAAGLR